MHRVLLRILALACLVPSAAGAQQPAAAQSPPRPGTIVVSLNKCPLNAPAKLDSASTAAFYPILDEMVKEGRLLGWGVLTHAWGDEWNHVIYYTATNTAAFHSAWSEIMRRMVQRQPSFMQTFASLCTEHKDNIYSVMRTGAPAPR